MNQKQQNQTKTLYNPTREDFTVTYAEVETPIPYTLHAQELATFPRHIAEHILKHLSQKIALAMHDSLNYPDRYAKAVKMVEAEI